MRKQIDLSCVAFAAVAVFALAGCNTGDIGVEATGPVAGSGSSAGANPPSSSGSHSISSGNGTAAGIPVYFEHTRTDAVGNTTLLGISFQDTGNEDGSPSEVPLKSEQDLPGYPAFGHDGSGVIYLYSPRFSEDTLVDVDVGTLRASTLYTFASRVRVFSESPSGNRVAWIDETGKIGVASLPQGASSTLELGAGLAPATDLLWNSTGDLLLVRAPKGAAVFALKGGAWTSVWTEADSVASVFSPDGKSLAFVTSDGTAYLARPGDETSKNSLAGILDSAQVKDLTWSSGTTLAYWSGFAPGVNEVHAFDIALGKDVALARLSIADKTGTGIVCPVAIGNSVYFSDSDEGQFVIERVDLDSAGAQPAVFAQPLSEDEGYVCPRD